MLLSAYAFIFTGVLNSEYDKRQSALNKVLPNYTPVWYAFSTNPPLK